MRDPAPGSFSIVICGKPGLGQEILDRVTELLMCYVYVLCSLKNNRYYIGSTNNLKRRLAEHNRGESLSLRNKGPFKLVYCEEYAAKRDAILREKQIKSYKSGVAFKKLLVKGSTPSSSLV